MVPPHPQGSSGWPAEAASPDVDGLLASAGYRVRSLEPGHVAQSLERLESAAMVVGGGVAGGDEYVAALEAVHYNPNDLTSWVDSMLSDQFTPSVAVPEPPPRPHPDTWTAGQIMYPQPPQQEMVATAAARQMEQEEDSGIRLVHLLMSGAEAVQRGDAVLASSLIDEMRMVLSRVNTSAGIGKVAGYFVDALCRRIYSSAGGGVVAGEVPPAEHEFLYHHFYEACPYVKFAHFTANQAILEAFEGNDRVHVVDFNLMHGLQWPALIQALALRPGGPPFLRLTGIGPPSPDGRDSLREIGLRLAELARSVHVRFAFRGVAAARLDDVRPWMLQVDPGEALAVNSVLQLHHLLGDATNAPIDSVLGWVAGLNPKIVTVVEQEADHNKTNFLDRFTEALFYYSTMFDSLEAGRSAGGGSRSNQQQAAAAVAEAYLQRELCNVVCCEGDARTERHEPLSQWRSRLTRAGLRPVHLGSNAFKQASMLLTLFSGEGYCVEEVDGCLTLGWHGRPLISASAWSAAAAGDETAPPPVGGVSSSNSSGNRSTGSGGNNITTSISRV